MFPLRMLAKQIIKSKGLEQKKKKERHSVCVCKACSETLSIQPSTQCDCTPESPAHLENLHLERLTAIQPTCKPVREDSSVAEKKSGWGGVGLEKLQTKRVAVG